MPALPSGTVTLHFTDIEGAMEHAVRLGDLRAGLHSGEIEWRGEVLVSSTGNNLVADSGLRFEDPGLHSFKRMPGEWRLFAAV